jgi:hypothetical protein
LAALAALEDLEVEELKLLSGTAGAVSPERIAEPVGRKFKALKRLK